MCPNFGHPALNPSFTKYNFCRWKIVLQHLWMNFQFWNCFSFRMVICCFRSMTTACTMRVNLGWRSKGRVSELGHTTLWTEFYRYIRKYILIIITLNISHSSYIKLFSFSFYNFNCKFWQIFKLLHHWFGRQIDT